jgi:hypothetical protein
MKALDFEMEPTQKRVFGVTHEKPALKPVRLGERSGTPLTAFRSGYNTQRAD